ncbi:MAG TPA: serine protease [Caulobacteraceae bacterium]|nr:serine protease [Caulobacteraceae bacterium]
MSLRPPDWLLFMGLIATLIGAAIVGQFIGAPPSSRTPRTPPSSTQAAPPSPGLPPASPFDPTVTVDAPSISKPGAGTAFSISSGGMWLTARHVVEGCARTAIVVGKGQGVAAEVRLDPHGETAVLITEGGAPALPLAPRRSLQPGMTAFHAGFPNGHPGQVVSRLIRRETLVLRGHRTRRESVLAWAETDQDDPPPANLAGLSGAPALDAYGRVIGVTIAQSPHHARVYTTTPGALRAAIARAHIQPATGARGAPMSSGSYEKISRDLRRDLRIVPVVCLGA